MTFSRFILFSLFTLLAVTTFNTAYGQQSIPTPKWELVEKKLKKNRLSKGFIQALKKNYDPSTFTDVLELNTLLFLRKSDYHGTQVSDEAVDRVTSFMAENKKILNHAEKQFGVDSFVIASLLFIESRYGKNTGTFDVCSVFAHLAQLDRPEILDYLYSQTSKFSLEVISAEDKKRIVEMKTRKEKWALEELSALNRMYKRDKKLTMQLRGSFSGAFGIAQFIPSSFMVYARSKNNKVADLSKVDDAVTSVANYLKKSGWRKNKTKALLKYNNSLDYANAILKLAKESKASQRRTPAESENRKN
ncbi:MAG: lytic murein transglycosylase [Pseudobdellovibrionaceae bacterium]